MSSVLLTMSKTEKDPNSAFRSSIRFSLFTILIANRIMWSVRYSYNRNHANKRKFKISYKLPLLIERTSYIVKIITCGTDLNIGMIS